MKLFILGVLFFTGVGTIPAVLILIWMQMEDTRNEQRRQWQANVK